MLIKPEILYSILINNSVAKNRLDKLSVLTDIYEINTIFLTKYSTIKRISQFEKYKNKKSQTIIELIEIINHLETENIIKKMFINIIKTGQFDIAENVYNILLKKWGFIKIDFISATQNTKKIDLSNLSNVAKINYKYDPAIIDGNIMILNSLKIDNSILGRLNSIENKIINSIA